MPFVALFVVGVLLGGVAAGVVTPPAAQSAVQIPKWIKDANKKYGLDKLQGREKQGGGGGGGGGVGRDVKSIVSDIVAGPAAAAPRYAVAAAGVTPGPSAPSGAGGDPASMNAQIAAVNGIFVGPGTTGPPPVSAGPGPQYTGGSAFGLNPG